MKRGFFCVNCRLVLFRYKRPRCLLLPIKNVMAARVVMSTASACPAAARHGKQRNSVGGVRLPSVVRVSPRGARRLAALWACVGGQLEQALTRNLGSADHHPAGAVRTMVLAM